MKKIRENITSQVNSLGIANRSIKEIKTKWTNMHQTAKKEISSKKIYQRKMGGGPCAKPLSVASEKIVDLYKDSPTFNGLSGFKTQSTDESNIEVIGSPTTVLILTEFLIPSVQENGDQVTDEFCEQARNDESLTTVAKEKPTSSTITTATTCMESSMSKNVGNIDQRKRIRLEDVTQMQYAVLVKQQRKLQEQTTFYMLMNKKLRRELEMLSEV